METKEHEIARLCREIGERQLRIQALVRPAVIPSVPTPYEPMISTGITPEWRRNIGTAHTVLDKSVTSGAVTVTGE
jgi:hypothetical protein